MNANSEQTIELDGIEVSLSRSTLDGMILVQVDTAEASDDDQFSNGVPKIRIGINDDYGQLDNNGDWQACAGPDYSTKG